MVDELNVKDRTRENEKHVSFFGDEVTCSSTTQPRILKGTFITCPISILWKFMSSARESIRHRHEAASHRHSSPATAASDNRCSLTTVSRNDTEKMAL